jgi:hypothetical protein
MAQSVRGGHVFPCFAHPSARLEHDAALGQWHVVQRLGRGIAQIKAEAEVIASSAQDHGGGLVILLETAGDLRKLAHQVERQRVGLVAAIKADRGDAACAGDLDQRHISPAFLRTARPTPRAARR